MSRLWKFLREKRNREILAWLGGGAVVLAGGIWTAVVFFSSPTPSGGGGSGDRIDCTIQQNQGNAACRDLVIGTPPPKP